MTRLGITGHQSIPEVAQDFISEAIERAIRAAASSGELWGITSLAAGADQLFTELMLNAGGRVRIVLPSRGYEGTFDAGGLRRFRTLLASATEVERLAFDRPTEESFL